MLTYATLRSVEVKLANGREQSILVDIEEPSNISSGHIVLDRVARLIFDANSEIVDFIKCFHSRRSKFYPITRPPNTALDTSVLTRIEPPSGSAHRSLWNLQRAITAAMRYRELQTGTNYIIEESLRHGQKGDRPKSLDLYILTDACWNSAPTLRSIMKTLFTSLRPEEDVRIHFIVLEYDANAPHRIDRFLSDLDHFNHA